LWGGLGCWIVRIKACLDPTDVDPNGHDPTKKSIAANIFSKNEISGPRKNVGKIIGKTGENIVGGNIPKFEQTGLHFSKRGLPFDRLRDRRPLPKSNLRHFMTVVVS
jgi:hypothetical protein